MYKIFFTLISVKKYEVLFDYLIAVLFDGRDIAKMRSLVICLRSFIPSLLIF